MVLKRFSPLFFFLFLLCFAVTAAAAPLTRIPTAWVDEFEAFLMWYAKDKGWDREIGLDIQMTQYRSGEEILNAPDGSWFFAGMGAVPAIRGNLRGPVVAIASGGDEAAANGVVLRQDTAMSRAQGWNTDYPDVLGSPETVKGKTFLVSSFSSAHYALSAWLHVLGLQDSDVTIKSLPPGQVLAGFENRLGDGAALHSPRLFMALGQGGTLAATLKDCGRTCPALIVAAPAYARSAPDTTARFLSVYFRAVAAFRSSSPQSFLPDYRRFYLEFAGKEYAEDLALKDLESRKTFSLEEQRALFDETSGPSKMQGELQSIALFFNDMGRLTPAEGLKAKSNIFSDGQYIRLVPSDLFLKR